MDTFVKNITSETITLCDLNNIVLPPNKIVNLLTFSSKKNIENSLDLKFAISNGLVQIGKWSPNNFIITEYHKSPERIDLDNINKITTTYISGYSTTCSGEFPIYVTTSFRLKADPVLDLEAATKHYVDIQDTATLAAALEALSHIFDGDVTIGGDLTVVGTITTPQLFVDTINGTSSSDGCLLTINCNLKLNDYSSGFLVTDSDGNVGLDTNTYITTVVADTPLSGSGTADSHLVIADAAADGVTKGAAAFNSTNFTAAAGIVNTIQNIHTAATPTFATLTLNSTTNNNFDNTITASVSDMLAINLIKNTLTISFSTGAANVGRVLRGFYNVISDSRTLSNTGALNRDSVYCVSTLLTRTAVSTAVITNLNAIYGILNDSSTYNKSNAGSSVDFYGTNNQITTNFTYVGVAETLTYSLYGSFISVTGTPIVTSGTLNQTIYGYNATMSGNAVGSSTGYGFWTNISGYDTNWAFYNSSASDNFLGLDTSRTAFGTSGVTDSYIAFDAANLDIFSSAAFDLMTSTNTDLVLNFIGTTNSGILTWMEDEDYFKFGDDVAIPNGEFLILPQESGAGIKVDTTTPTFGWKDLLGNVNTRPTAGAGAAAVPDYIVYRTPIYAYFFGTAAPDNHLHEAFIEFHMPHDYVPSTDIYIHTHWSQITADGGGPGICEWNFDISYADGYGTAGGAGDPFVAPKTITKTLQASTTQYAHMLSEVIITGAADTATTFDRTKPKIDGIFLVRVWRDPTALADTLTQGVFLHFVDMHYQTTGLMGTKNKNTPFYS